MSKRKKRFADIPAYHLTDARDTTKATRQALKFFRAELKRGSCSAAYDNLLNAHIRGGKALVSRHYSTQAKTRGGSGVAAALKIARDRFRSACVKARK